MNVQMGEDKDGEVWCDARILHRSHPAEAASLWTVGFSEKEHMQLFRQQPGLLKVQRVLPTWFHPTELGGLRRCVYMLLAWT